ncbi:MAG: PEP/pyruvate-binding domain-containing protein [Nanoarchaeota archaeon]|nr:PEP/pyruvate-binding domain-containing protein [Nanoarchaeota archaeon]
MITWLHQPSILTTTKTQLLNNLAEKKLPVPKGFVISPEDYHTFLTHNNLDLTFLENLNLEDDNQTSHALQQLQQQFQQATYPEELKQAILEAYDQLTIDQELYHHLSKEALSIIKTGRDPPRVIIRTATTNHEGTTQYNIKGKEQLLEHIKKAWLSTLPEQQPELIIQTMITIEKSCIINDEEQPTIEAALGNPEAITTKLIQPDIYTITTEGIQKTINRQDFLLSRDGQTGILTKKPIYYQGNNQKFTDYEIQAVTELYHLIKQHQQEPLSIELGLTTNQPHILTIKLLQQKPAIIEQAITQAINNHEEPETTKEDITTITEVSAYLTNNNNYYPCDGAYTTNKEELRTMTNNYHQKCLWYGLHNLEDINDIRQLHDEGHTNLGISIINPGTTEILRQTKKILKKQGLEPLEEIEVGITIEAPATVYLMDDIEREGIDFVIVNHEALANNSQGKQQPDYKHKGYLKLLQHLVKECKLRNIEIGIAGNFDDELLDFLVKIGFDTIIVPVEQLETTRKNVARSEKRLLLSAARKDLKEL